MEKLKGKVIYSRNYEEAEEITNFLLEIGTWCAVFSKPIYYDIGGEVYEYMPDNCELITLEQAKELVKEPLAFPRIMEVRHYTDEEWGKRVVIAYKQNKYISWVDAETMEEAEKQVMTITWAYAREIQRTKLTIAEIEKRLGIANLEII